MEPKTEIPKLSNMVMCGDHPSFNKTELNAKESVDEKELVEPGSKLSNTSAREERPVRPRSARGSGHALRPARRADRAPAGAVAAVAGANAHSGALVQAALGSFRWPPFLLTVWVLVLVLTHALHCLVGCLERALPRLRHFCQYLRSCTERSWRAASPASPSSSPSPSPSPAGRAAPAALAALTGLFYAVYFALYITYSVALWSIEPLAVEEKEDEPEVKVTDYVEEPGKGDDN